MGNSRVKNTNIKMAKKIKKLNTMCTITGIT